MPLSPLSRCLFAVVALLAMFAAGCGNRYVNPDITDPAQSRRQLALDKALCKDLAKDTVPPTYGMDRYSMDPTIEGQAGQFVANAVEDDNRQDVFTRCMRDRGWRLR